MMKAIGSRGQWHQCYFLQNHYCTEKDQCSCVTARWQSFCIRNGYHLLPLNTTSINDLVSIPYIDKIINMFWIFKT